jgi:uncharacterized protein (DUF1501 family)
MNEYPLGFFSRRDFLRSSAYTAGTAAMWLSLGGTARAAADTSGYKALVCVWLAGGNNGFNMVVPQSPTAYAAYAASRGNLALAQNTLLPLDGTASDGYAYGLHPSMAGTQSLFNAGRLCVVGNVGTLVQPTTVAEAKAASVLLPRQLFSHLDQTTAWMTSLPDQAIRTGWAGRMADVLAQQGFAPTLAANLTLAGNNYWQEGAVTQPYTMSTGTAAKLQVTSNPYYRAGARQTVARAFIDQARGDSNLLMAEFADLLVSADSKVDIVNNALAAAGDLTTTFPALAGDWGLGAQLHQVARTIKAHAALDARQMFFVRLGGFDTHNAELATQATLLNVLSVNLAAFWQAMSEIGLQDSVTLFTISDFGRTLGSNGDGSDHAWGNHHLVLGGAVKGGWHGRMPELALGGADDVGQGRIVPTTSTDQYGATLARWFGIDDAGLNAVFPNLKNFPTRTLPFLG